VKTRLYFELADRIGFSLPDGAYSPRFRLLGNHECDLAPFSQLIEAVGTTEYAPSSPEGGVGSGVSPSTGVLWVTQAGGVFGTHIINAVPGWREGLISLEAAWKEWPLDWQPEGPPFHISTHYLYLATGQYKKVYGYIAPPGDWIRGAPYLVDITVSPWPWCPPPPIICMIGIVSASWWVFVVDRDARASIEEMVAEDTFLVRGDHATVRVNAANPETGGASSNYSVNPSTGLTFFKDVADVTSAFSPTLTNPSTTIPPSASRALEFQVVPAPSAPPGLVTFDTTLSTTGVYPYCLGTCPEDYEGSPTVTFTGEVQGTDFVPRGEIYVVDSQPLSTAPDSLEPGLVGRHASTFPTTVDVANNSDLDFLIDPSSTLSIEFQPGFDFLLNTGAEHNSPQPQISNEVWQGIRPTEDTVLGPIHAWVQGSNIDWTMLVEVVDSNPDDTPSDTVLASASVPVSADAWEFTSPSLKAQLEGGRLYFIRLKSPFNPGTWVHPGVTDTYPAAPTYVRADPSNNVVQASGDLPMEFFIDSGPNLTYVGEGTWSGLVSLLAHGTLSLAFVNSEPVGTKADGIYTPDILLKGEFTDPEGTYDFHQHIVVGSETVLVDVTPPVASIGSMPSVEPTTFTVGWSGSDPVSGLASFDIQWRDQAVGVWTDWLTATSSTSAQFAGQDGHTYGFRVRATDGALNVGAWSAEVATTVDASGPDTTVAGLPPWSSDVFNVSWSATDALSAVVSFDVEYRKAPATEWTGWLAGTTDSGGTFSAVEGVFEFRARSTDALGNIGPWSEAASTGVDKTDPSAQIDQLPEWSPRDLVVTWSGLDNLSGIATYTVPYCDEWFSDGGGISCHSWGPTPQTYLAFSGQDGHRYTFRVSATDHAGNQSPESVNESTSVDSSVPSAWVNALPAVETTTTFTVSWSGIDSTSGVALFTVQVRVDGGTWEDWLGGTTSFSSGVTGADGHAYGFRAQAFDLAGNASGWSAEIVTRIQIPPTWKSFIPFVIR
jgi:hypothetical protein